MKIVIATHNKDKFKELYHGLKDLPVDLLNLYDFPEIEEIEENGKTLEENAFIKARTVYKKTGFAAIADDTGLEVDALNGAPGVYTARYAGENCSYSDNVNKMLLEMKNVPKTQRTATFKTVMTFVSERKELISEGKVEGMIAENKKGIAGFGYDPIFYVVEERKTFAEMTIDKKNIISHRARAIMNLKHDLRSYLNLIKENA